MVLLFLLGKGSLRPYFLTFNFTNKEAGAGRLNFWSMSHLTCDILKSVPVLLTSQTCRLHLINELIEYYQYLFVSYVKTVFCIAVSNFRVDRFLSSVSVSLLCTLRLVPPTLILS